MKPTEALDAIKRDADIIIGQEVHNLHRWLVQSSPVDTGHFKASWKAPRKTGFGWWIIHNSAEYASILAAGRYHALGRWYGSLQWAGGVAPMLAKTTNTIKRRLDAIRY